VRDGKSVYRNLTARAVRQDLEDSLLRMKTDYIDVYITHRQSEGTPVEQTMGELLKLRAEGKIRAIGISNASPEILSDYLRFGHVALVQEKFSMLTRGAKVAYIPACERAGTAFQAFASLEAGALSSKEQLGRAFPQGDYRARNKWFTQEMRPEMERFYAALEPLCEKYGCSFANLVQAWTLAQSDCMNLLTGIRRVSSLLDSAKAAEIEIKAEDLAAIDAACDALQAQ
jgi:methylglyoxal reductase